MEEMFRSTSRDCWPFLNNKFCYKNVSYNNKLSVLNTTYRKVKIKQSIISLLKCTVICNAKLLEINLKAKSVERI